MFQRCPRCVFRDGNKGSITGVGNNGLVRGRFLMDFAKTTTADVDDVRRRSNIYEYGAVAYISLRLDVQQ